jgi:predicted dehydrogenase
MYPEVDSVVYVYAPPGPDLDMHLKRIATFNARDQDPTSWVLKTYAADDYLEKMADEKAGNVVVISGNNEKKIRYIKRSLEAGMHVLADKPMAITPEDFHNLTDAFALARDKGLLLYDIMTERYEITTMLQRELSRVPEIFGTLQQGTPEAPAITKESVHHFYKYVSGSVLTRPAWFMDVRQQGEGIVDVTTHLVDLVQWECFPDQVIDTSAIHLIDARRWPTTMTQHQFRAITNLDGFPDYLKKDVKDTILNIFANGEIRYRINGVHAKVSVTWAYQAPPGAGDTHHSVMRGTKATLAIRQCEDQQFKPTLYIEAVDPSSIYAEQLREAFKPLQSRYPGIDLNETDKGWEVVIPDLYREGHEAHFARVTEKFLEYVTDLSLPDWEVPNMIAKYYTTTKALELAQKK